MGEARTRGLSWSVALRLGRVSNLPTVWTNVLAGVAIAGGIAMSCEMVALILALSLFYIGGMFLNDAFDREFDRERRPERPIPAGQVSADRVFAVGFGLLAAGCTLLAAIAATGLGGGWRLPAAGAVLAALIVGYDVRHKGNPVSPLVMAACRAMVYVIAGFAVSTEGLEQVWPAALVLCTYVIGLTYVAKQETLSRAENLWPLALLGAPFVYALPMLARDAVGAALYAAFAAWVAYALWHLMKKPRADVPRAVTALIAGISLLDAVLIAHAGAHALAALAVAGFAATLVGQRHVPGT